MTQELRWAARYAFVEEQWRGRARVIVDPGLETLLREGGPGVERGIDPALDDLLERLLPLDPAHGEAVWMAVATVSIAAELGRLRPGTTFVPYEGIADVLRRAHWDVAIVDLAAAVLGPPEGSPEMTTEPDMQAPAFGAGVYFRRALATVSTLGMTLRDDRTVVLCTPVRDYPRIEEGLEYGELFELAEQTLGPPRLFGVYCPPMAAVVDFGDADESPDDVATEVLDEPDEVSLSYDNTLGSQEPALTEYLAVVGQSDDLSGGLTLVELPHLAHLASLAGETAESGARAQLMQARRRADLAAIERQDQLERAEELERENADLRRELEARAEAQPAARSAPAPVPAFDRESALEAALGREQALKWRVGQLEAELLRVRARPIEALEAEVAALQAQLEADQTPAGDVAEMDDLAGAPQEQLDEDPAEVVIIEEAPGLPQSRLVAIHTRLGHIMTRIERGGMPTLALRQELCALRRLLRA